jgi:hypothetical protein
MRSKRQDKMEAFVRDIVEAHVQENQRLDDPDGQSWLPRPCRCAACGGTGHNRRTCPSVAPEKRAATCRSCAEIGHTASACPQRPSEFRRVLCELDRASLELVRVRTERDQALEERDAARAEIRALLAKT